MIYRIPDWRTLGLTAAIALVASALFAFSKPAEMRVDGQHLDSDVAPITTVQGKVYVPLRALATAIGGDTYSQGKSGAVTVVRGNQSFKFAVGNRRITVNGMPLTLKRAPFRVRGRVMIGLRAFARAFGVRVGYDHRTSRIDIRTDNSTPTGPQPAE